MVVDREGVSRQLYPYLVSHPWLPRTTIHCGAYDTLAMEDRGGG